MSIEEEIKYLENLSKYMQNLNDDKIKKELENEIKEELENAKNANTKNKSENFKKLQKKIFANFGQEVHDISNLALLSKNLNSHLGNEIFAQKREKIIKKDKIGEFIPIATKNVFLKYFGKNDDQNWGKDDQESYIKEIKTSIKKYLEAENDNK